jgi:hypothetical protein
MRLGVELDHAGPARWAWSDDRALVRQGVAGGHRVYRRLGRTRAPDQRLPIYETIVDDGRPV